MRPTVQVTVSDAKQYKNHTIGTDPYDSPMFTFPLTRFYDTQVEISNSLVGIQWPQTRFMDYDITDIPYPRNLWQCIMA